MNFSEKLNEAYHTVIDKVGEDKKLDEKLVLQQTKDQLLKLHEDVSYAWVVLEQLKKTNWVDAAKFAQLDAQLSLTGGIKFYIKSYPGELVLKFDKSKNNADDYTKFKKMCEGIKAIIQKN